MLICRVRYQEFKEASKYNTHTRNKRLILGIQFETCCRRPKHISFRSFFDHFCNTSCGFLRNDFGLEFSKHATKAKLLFCFASYYVMYKVFSHDVTAAILVSQNNETAAMLVSQTNPVGVELFSYANAFFCSHKFA